jgi:hypothetical protein
MCSHPAILRFFLVLTLLPSIVVGLFGWKHIRYAQELRKSYDSIELGTDAYEVERRLGEGTMVTNSEWPKTLGELPNCEMIAVTFVTPDGMEFKWKPESSRPIWWERWDDLPGQFPWVAVAFMSGESTGRIPFVVATKRGGRGRLR